MHGVCQELFFGRFRSEKPKKYFKKGRILKEKLE
jgi:hypothetical protein